jgi:hypothetical protein
MYYIIRQRSFNDKLKKTSERLEVERKRASSQNNNQAPLAPSFDN